MAFKFRFESILNLKIRMEDMKKSEFKSISEKLEEEKEKLKNLTQERELQYEKMKIKQEQSISKQEMITFNNYINVLKKRITLQNQVVLEVSQVETGNLGGGFTDFPYDLIGVDTIKLIEE